MNTTETVRKHCTARNISVLFAITLLLTGAHSSFGHPLSVPANEVDTVLIQKQTTSKKHRIKLYQDAEQNVLFFSARGSEGKIYQLFLFDVTGALVKQANIKSKQTTVIDNIEKGNYLFEVFSDDERIENGQVIIR